MKKNSCKLPHQVQIKIVAPLEKVIKYTNFRFRDGNRGGVPLLSILFLVIVVPTSPGSTLVIMILTIRYSRLKLLL